MRTAQLSIFSGSTLKERGIKQATDHADRVSSQWSKRAFELFRVYLDRLPPPYVFQIEDFREWAYRQGLEAPPSLRAFGFIPGRAVKAGLIVSAGFAKVSNAKAHQANAAVWRKI